MWAMMRSIELRRKFADETNRVETNRQKALGNQVSPAQENNCLKVLGAAML